MRILARKLTRNSTILEKIAVIYKRQEVQIDILKVDKALLIVRAKTIKASIKII
jgi:hypothetical protein